MRYWVKLDVDYYESDAMLGVSAGAELLYVRVMALAKKNRLDGQISRRQLVRLTHKCAETLDDMVMDLVREGLWTDIGGVYEIAGWEESNDPVADEDRRRDQDNARKRKWRQARTGTAEPSRDASRDADATTSRRGRDANATALDTDTEVDTETETDSEKDKTRAPASPTMSPAKAADATFTPHPDVDQLCAYLADRIERHGKAGSRPNVTIGWRRSIDLLLRRGPTKVKRRNGPPSPVEVRALIDYVFDYLNVPDKGFCWADQIRSADGLREKWAQIEERFAQAHANHQRTSSVIDDAARRFGQPA